MDQLKDEMQYSKEDLGHRLGREEEKKPEIKVMKIEGEMPGMADHEDEGDLEDDMQEEMDMGGPMAKLKGMPFSGKESMDEEDGEDDLKKRLMKLRG